MKSQDIVLTIRAAEAEADQLTRQAEASRRAAVAEAEAAAAQSLDQLDARLRSEREQALAQARAEAARLLDAAAAEAQAEAERVARVVPDRLARAAAILVKAVREQWQ